MIKAILTIISTNNITDICYIINYSDYNNTRSNNINNNENNYDTISSLYNYNFPYTASLCLIIVLLLFMHTQVFLRVQCLALCISPCILSLCLSLSTHTLSYTIHLLMTYNNRYLLHFEKMSELLHSMNSFISDVKAWATAIMPKLNDS